MMKIFGMNSGRLTLRLLIVAGAAAVVSGAAMLAGGLHLSIREGESWPRTVVGNGISIDRSLTFESAGIDRIVVDMGFEDISVSSAADGSGVINIRYHGTVQTAGANRDGLTAETDDGNLVIESLLKRTAVINGRATVDVSLPENWSGDLVITGASGSVGADGLRPARLEVRLMSGNIDLNDVVTGPASARTASGRLEVTDLRASEAVLETVSGSIRIERLAVEGNLELGTASGGIGATDISAVQTAGWSISGDVDLDEVSGSLDLKNTSGGVEVSFREPGRRISVDNTSGDILVRLPGGTDFDLDARTVSGRVRSDLPLTVSGDLSGRSLVGISGRTGQREIVLNATSGDVSVGEY